MTTPTVAERGILTAIALGRPLRPVPTPSLRPWAGRRLASATGGVGELWLAGPESRLFVAPHESVTLDRLAALAGTSLVGERGMRLLGARFPLIVKLIDAAEWLSLQVHPSDDLAIELYGAGAVGKTEAWLVLDADPGSALVTGPSASLDEAGLRAGIRAGTLGRADCEVRPATPGDAFLVPAGTLHAIGAGTFMYEIEQPSDLTFRISDWGRPPVAGRSLHPTESLRAIVPSAHIRPAGSGWQLEGGALSVPEFRLEVTRLPERLERRPTGRSLEVVTTIEGEAQVAGDGWSERLGARETLVVPAAAPGYAITGASGLVCIGSIP